MAFYYCLLLDQDGTLLDFDAAEKVAISNTLEQFELPNTPQAVETYHNINKELWQALERGEIRQEKLVVRRFERLLEAFGEKGDAVRMNDYFLTSLSQSAQLIDGVSEVLPELAEVATLAVVTNGIEKVQSTRLESCKIADYMDDVFVSSKVGASKPSRKIFDYALRNLGIENKERVLVVGDSLKADIAGAAAAGLKTCWCNFNNEELPENAVKPDYIINHFEELLQIVLEQEELENVGNAQRRHKF